MSFPRAKSTTSVDGSEVVRYEDPALGIYKKLTLKDGKSAPESSWSATPPTATLHGLVAQRHGLAPMRTQLLFPPPEDAGTRCAEMADSETVCGCMGVTKGTIIQAIHEKGISTLGAAQGMHARLHGLRKLLRPLPAACSKRGRAGIRGRSARSRSASAFRSRRSICARLCAANSCSSVQDVLDIYGNGTGCEVCKPALELYGRHAVVRRSRRRPLGALHQRPRTRQYSEGWNVLRGAAHSRRRHLSGRTAPHRRCGRQIQRADGQDHRQPAHRSAGREEVRPSRKSGPILACLPVRRTPKASAW